MSTMIKDKNSTEKIMCHLIIALTPIILFAVYKNGIVPYIYNKISFIEIFYPLLFILLPAGVTFGLELLFGFLVKKERGSNLFKYVKNSYAFFPGLFLGLICPLNLPLSILILGAIAASILGKLVFGGFGQNIFNPALIGYIIIVSSYSLFFSSNNYLNKYEIDTISGSTPLTTIKTVENNISYDTIVKPYGDLGDFFLGFIPGSAGEVSGILCICAFIYLVLTKTIKWQIPVFYVSTVFILTTIIGIILGQGLYYPVVHLLSGGLLFGAVFMATDPVTSPVTKPGMILGAIIMGILTVFLRYNSSYPEGVATSILVMNLLTFILDKIGYNIKFDLNKYLIPVIILIGIMTSVVIASVSKFNQSNDIDPKFTLINKRIESNKVIYEVSEKGYSSNIKAIIEIENGIVSKYEVFSQNESFYSTIEDNNYIDKLVKNASNLDNVDTISGATFTSSALKKLLINVLNDYRKEFSQNENINIQEDALNFEIISLDENSYIIKQNDLIVKLSVLEEKISDIEILSNDNNYQNNECIDKLIINQDNLDEVECASNDFKNILIEMRKVLYER